MRKLHFIYILLAAVLIFTGCSSRGGQPFQNEYGSGGHVARINVEGYGCMDLRLFDDQAPEAVESFISLAQSGAFDNVSIGTIIQNYYLGINAAGSDDHTEEGSIDLNNGLYPFYGSLFISTEDIGSVSAASFCINCSNTEDLISLYELLDYKGVSASDYFSKAYGTELTVKELAYYDTYGGTPWLQGHCLVFGQIYDGFDVLESIMDATMSEDNSYQPDPEIIISSVEIK